MKPSIVAVIATYRRAAEVARLLISIDALQTPLAGVVVVDNGSSDQVRQILAATRTRTYYVDPGKNLGCGAGLQLAEKTALAFTDPPCTHVLVLDDDAVLQPDSVERLLTTMAEWKADFAYPLVVDAHGHVGWLPGIGISGRASRALGRITPAEFRERVVGKPRPLEAALGICLLLTRRILETAGLHRDDFWIRGEDIEFSVRCTKFGLGIFVPDALVEHLPPDGLTITSMPEAEYLKHCALVQNNSFIAFRLRRSWTHLRGVGGTLRHFFVTWGMKAVPDAIRAVWRGAIVGDPAGAGRGRTFQARFAELMRAS